MSWKDKGAAQLDNGRIILFGGSSEKSTLIFDINPANGNLLLM